MLCLSGFELYSRWVPLISKGVFERRTSTGSEATKFAFPSVFIIIETKIETICPNFGQNHRLKIKFAHYLICL